MGAWDKQWLGKQDQAPHIPDQGRGTSTAGLPEAFMKATGEGGAQNGEGMG
jgi:hypothetical protein